MSAPHIKQPNKRSLRRLAQIAREFNRMDQTIEKISPKPGDVLFFKGGFQAATIEVFLQHLHDRGIKDCIAMAVGPDDSAEVVAAERLQELAQAAGYVKGDPDESSARLNRQKGRHDVLRLLEAIEKEHTSKSHGSSEESFTSGVMTGLIARIREAITISGNGKEAAPAPPLQEGRPYT